MNKPQSAQYFPINRKLATITNFYEISLNSEEALSFEIIKRTFSLKVKKYNILINGRKEEKPCQEQ